MYCTKCGKELPEGNAFCPFCGQAQDGKNTPATDTPKVPYTPAQPGVLQIFTKGEYIAPSIYSMLKLAKKGTGYYFYVDGVKYKTKDHPQGVTVRLTPGSHILFATASPIQNEHLLAAGEIAENNGAYFGDNGILYGTALNIAAKLNNAVVGDKGTGRYVVDINSGEHVTIQITLENGKIFPSFIFEELERS